MYHPLIGAAVDTPGVGGCFPAAHPLSGYAWLAVGFALYFGDRRRSWQSWALAFGLGTLFGVVQIARGAHFLSHVLWSAWIVWGVNVALLGACPPAGRGATPCSRPILASLPSRGSDQSPGRARDVLDVLVVLVADVFHQLLAGPQRGRVLDRERPRVGAGIVDRRDVLELAELRARIALDRVQLLVCGWPAKSNQNCSLKPTVSITSVSPSHWPMEWPYHVGSRSSGCLRPSMKICRKLWMLPSNRKNK